MNQRKRTVVVGATSAMALHCARQWAKRGDSDFWLVGRHAERLQTIAQDLQTRDSSAQVNVWAIDFNDPRAIAAAVLDISARGQVDRVLIAHGWLPNQTLCEQDMPMLCEALMVNGVSAVLFAQAFAQQMAQNAQPSVLAVIGSVAGDRGRKSNAIYGAAKSMVSTCVQGLQHRFAGTPLQCVLIKPGPTRTPMTQLLDIPDSRLAPVEMVADDIVRAMDRRQSLVYTPAKWWWIMWVIRNLPSFIFNRLNI